MGETATEGDMMDFNEWVTFAAACLASGEPPATCASKADRMLEMFRSRYLSTKGESSGKVEEDRSSTGN